MTTAPHNSVPRGTIVLCNRSGRALRKGCAAITASELVDCCGEFGVGDTVNVTFRGADGGQFAIATAIVAIDAAALRSRIAAISARSAPLDDITVATEHNLKLLWPIM